MKFFSLYDPPVDPGIAFDPDVDSDRSLTQQHFKDECDVNLIMDKYCTTGILGDPLANPDVLPQFGDFSSPADFHAAQTVIAHASQSFDMLDAKLRKRFENDPAQLLEFLNDDSNREEAIRLGLVANPVPANNAGSQLPSSAAAGASSGANGSE